MDKKDTDKITTKPELFSENMRFTKWLRQLENHSSLINVDVWYPLDYLQHLDTAPLSGVDLAHLPAL